MMMFRMKMLVMTVYRQTDTRYEMTMINIQNQEGDDNENIEGDQDGIYDQDNDNVQNEDDEDNARVEKVIIK